MASKAEEVQDLLDQAEEALESMLEQASQAQGLGLQRFAALQERRAQRLGLVSKRLEPALGSEHPRVVALKQAASVAGALQRNVAATARREGRRPRVKPHEWAVFGRVVDAKGHPVAGVRVRVFDKDRRYDDLLGETTTDEFGDFAVVYHVRDFLEAGEKAPELYLEVRDKRGQVLFSSEEVLRYNAGRAEYFEVVLEEEKRKPGGRRRPRRGS